jgi:hypothetical protein
MMRHIVQWLLVVLYCGFVLLAAVIRGAKHWPFHKVSALWQSLVPLIRLALVNMTEETVADWGVCFATASVSQESDFHITTFFLNGEDLLTLTQPLSWKSSISNSIAMTRTKQSFSQNICNI